MQKSRFLIVAALAALAFCASAFATSPPDPAGGIPVAAEAFASSHDLVKAGTGHQAAVQAQTVKDVGSISLAPDRGAQTDCSTCRTASMHPGCGQREPHPSMAKGKRGGGKRCIEGIGMAHRGIPDQALTRST